MNQIYEGKWERGNQGRKSRLYKIWDNMNSRCKNPNASKYNNYGGRGIKVCDDWSNDNQYGFQNFRSWSANNGYDDNLTIDRIDSDKDYCPENCRWVTYKVQNTNKRNNKLFTMNGKSQTLVEWCEELELDYKLISNRVCRKKWSLERAVSEPIHDNSIIVDNIKYNSLVDACEKLGKNYKVVSQRIYRYGWSVEDALTKSFRNKTIIYNNKEYLSIREICREIGVNYGTVLRRIKHGMTLEQALNK